MSVLFGIFIIGLALFCEAFFAGSETGIISTNRIRLSYLADKGDRRAKIIKNFLDAPERFLGTTLVGVNLSVIIGSSVASALVARSLTGPDYAPLVTTLIMLPLILVFGEIIPKSICRQYADTLSLWSAYPLKAVSSILFPLIWIATELAALAFVREKTKKSPYVTREEMHILLGESAKQGFLTKEEVKMAHEIFDFGKTDARSVMVPLSDVVAAPDKAGVEELKELVAMSGYSRIPIYREKPENIIGTIQLSDLLGEDIKNTDITAIIRRSYSVQEERPIEELLKDFKTNQKNIAIVTTKDNRAVGIVTLEDVIEEIVGDIEDEYDTG